MTVPIPAALLVAALFQESVAPPPPRLALPRPVANAPVAQLNDNRQPAGTLSNGRLTLALDIVESAFQAEGDHDPIVRALAFAEAGKAPQIPGPLLRAPVGTFVHLTVRNRSDSAVMVGGLRPSLPSGRDTVHIAAGATREITFRLEKVGNFFYWAALKGLRSFEDRYWLDSQLTGAFIVDPPGALPSANERVWLITEWFFQPPKVRTFESALVFNGKAWPYNERLGTLAAPRLDHGPPAALKGLLQKHGDDPFERLVLEMIKDDFGHGAELTRTSGGAASSRASPPSRQWRRHAALR